MDIITKFKRLLDKYTDRKGFEAYVSNVGKWDHGFLRLHERVGLKGLFPYCILP